MSVSSLLALVVLGGAALPAATATAASGAPTSAPTSARVSAVPVRTAALTNAQFETKLLALTNARRKKVGCPAVKASTPLTRAARVHTRLMYLRQNLSHQLPGELGLGSRITKSGYKKWTALAENVAWGPATPAGVFSLWLNSAGHRANIQRCTYRDAGFGVVQTPSGPWVTLDLGRRR